MTDASPVASLLDELEGKAKASMKGNRLNPMYWIRSAVGSRPTIKRDALSREVAEKIKAEQRRTAHPKKGDVVTDNLRGAAQAALGYLCGAARAGNQGAAIIGQRLADALGVDWAEALAGEEDA